LVADTDKDIGVRECSDAVTDPCQGRDLWLRLVMDLADVPFDLVFDFDWLVFALPIPTLLLLLLLLLVFGSGPTQYNDKDSLLTLTLYSLIHCSLCDC
jgi:hypothetical protein